MHGVFIVNKLAIKLLIQFDSITGWLSQWLSLNFTGCLYKVVSIKPCLVNTGGPHMALVSGM